MIISKTPLRLSYLGGGTDIPSFFEREDGVVLSTTINKYIYITVNDRFVDDFRVAYSRTEVVDNVDKIEHSRVRTVLQKFARQKKGLEIISMSDIPAGTGLGSSSSFTVGLLNALLTHLGRSPTKEELAREAVKIETVDLAEPIGKQDQYAAAYGGLQTIHFNKNGSVFVKPVACSGETARALESSTMMFFTGLTRSASAIFKEQSENTPAKFEELKQVKVWVQDLVKILEEGQSLKRFGEILHEGWGLKKSMATGISNAQIDQWYEAAIAAGAWGGKIVGAGGGGFLMMMCPPEKQPNVEKALSELRRTDFKFDVDGSRIIVST